MKGVDLRKAVKNSGIKIAEISESTGIPEQTIYSLYKKKVVPEHYISKMEAAGIKLQKTIVNDDIKELIAYLKLTVPDAVENNAFYRKQLDRAYDTIHRYIEDIGVPRSSKGKAASG